MQIDITHKDIQIEQKIITQNVNQYPWPIDNDSVERINCVHVVQMVPNLESFLREIYRISKPQGQVRIVCPYYSSLKASADPRNIRFINEYSFVYFDNDFRKANGLELNDFSFKCVHAGFQWKSPWDTKSEEVQEDARMHMLNVVEDVMLAMEVIKPIPVTE